MLAWDALPDGGWDAAGSVDTVVVALHAVSVPTRSNENALIFVTYPVCVRYLRRRFTGGHRRDRGGQTRF